MTKVYGLIGRVLSHSFSPAYFQQKFEQLGLTDHEYRLFELAHISEFPQLLQAHALSGLTVTMPYKTEVMAYLDECDPVAQAIGAVNTIKFLKGGKLCGYNTDRLGFRDSLLELLNENRPEKAILLGTGGASQAVQYVLQHDLHIDEVYRVSRQPADAHDTRLISYSQLTPELLGSASLIVNTTPLGMYPNTSSAPPIDYSAFTPAHYVYDLVYNPTETQFMQRAAAYGAQTMNGLQMLHRQADAAWCIWHS